MQASCSRSSRNICQLRIRTPIVRSSYYRLNQRVMPKRRRVSDVLMSTCCLPFSFVKLFLGRWIFGECFCRFHGFDVFTFGLASLYSIEITKISRYLCVVKDTLCYLKQEKLWHTLPSSGVPLYSDRCLRLSLEMVDLNSNQEKLAKCLYTFQTNIAYTAFIESVYVAVPLILIILHSKSETVLALKIGPFRWLKYSPIFESNLAPSNQGQYSPISHGWFGPKAEMGPTVDWNSFLIELVWPKLCSNGSRKGWIRLWPAGLNWH